MRCANALFSPRASGNHAENTDSVVRYTPSCISIGNQRMKVPLMLSFGHFLVQESPSSGAYPALQFLNAAARLFECAVTPAGRNGSGIVSNLYVVFARRSGCLDDPMSLTSLD